MSTIESGEKSYPKDIQDLFHKGFVAIERGSLDYAINMLAICVEKQPDFLQARKFLRAAQIQNFKKKKTNPLTHHITFISNLPLYIKVMVMMKTKKNREALVLVEKLLTKDPFNLNYVAMFANAARATELYEVGIQTLEIVKDQYLQDITLLKLLGDMYVKIGRIKEGRECFEKICELRPKDLAALKAVKDAMAVESMSGDGWNKASSDGGSYRDMIKDPKEAVLLEQQAKAVKTEKDIEALIVQVMTKIELQPEDMNAYRSLARLYVEKKDFEKALQMLGMAHKVNPADAEIERAITLTRSQQFDYDISELKKAGKDEEAANKEMEKRQFLFDELYENVKRYPNDPRLRYEWGLMLYENDHVNEAIPEFQLAQKSPQYRLKALYYLGMCFASKKQFDMAREMFEKAASELNVMNDTKKDIYYALGELADMTGDHAAASEYFKEIYQVDIGYRDVATKVEQSYNKPA